MSIILKTILERPGRVLISFSIMLIIAVLATGLISFEKDIFKVIPQNSLTFKVLVHSFKTSSSQDKLYLLIRGKENHQELLSAAMELIKELKGIRIGEEQAFSEVSMLKAGALDTQDFENLLKGFLARPENFLTKNDLVELKAVLTSQEAMEAELKKSLALFATPGSPIVSRMAITDPLNMRRFMVEKLQSIHQGLEFAPGPYLFSPDKRSLLIIATPSHKALGLAEARSLLEKIGGIRNSNKDISIGITGGYALNAQEEDLFRGDLISCLVGSALAIAILFLLVYRSVVVFSFIILPLGVGLQLALGTMAILFDRIHLLATAFATVVLGLGIDFAIHIYDRYKMERHAGKTIEQAAELSIYRTGASVLAGGLTTLSAFLVLTIIDNPLLSQIGWLVALGLMFCLITILWALPACLVWLDRRKGRTPGRQINQLGMAVLGKWISRHPFVALTLSAVLLALTVPGISFIRFEGRPTALQPRGLEAVEIREDLLGAFGGNQDYVLVAWRAKNIKAFREKSKALDLKMNDLEREGAISSWVSLNKLASLEPLYLEGVDRSTIDRVFQKYGLKLDDFIMTRQFIDAVTGSRENNLENCGYLEQFPDIFKRFFICEQDQVQGITWVRVSGKDKALQLQARLTKSFPDIILINPRLAVGELVSEVQNELGTTLLLAGIIVLGILTLFLRRISAVILTLLPMVLGLAATAGVMGWAGIQLNPFNFIVLPILLGIGLDDGIHIYRRFMELGEIRETLSTTGRSVLVTTLTTACGFGSLSLAEYHVLKGMGLMTIFGVLACFFFSVVTLPSVLRLLYKKKPQT
ncbi:RND family transporter [Thermodesulfobacteriota bacterium]